MAATQDLRNGTTEVAKLGRDTDFRGDSKANLYLDLMKKCLTRIAFPDNYRALKRPMFQRRPFTWSIYPLIGLVDSTLQHMGLKLYRYLPVDPAKRDVGDDWPAEAETMIGMKRLDNLQSCVVNAIQQNVPGDLIETGVWRGGACIFMRAILSAYGDQTRTVWVADSFRGLPKEDGRYVQDRGDSHWKLSDHIGISLQQVKANFERYGLLDDRVRFLQGWFKDTLPEAPIQQISVLRLDGDMYSSTMDALKSLYDKVSPNGWVIIDDYALPGCRGAVDQFRLDHNVTEEIQRIDSTGVFWQKRAL